MRTTHIKTLKLSALVFAIFTLIAFVATTQTYLFFELIGRTINWKLAFIESLISWYFWALTVPVAVWLAHRHLHLQNRIVKTILLILLTTAVIAVLKVVVNEVVFPYTHPERFKYPALGERIFVSLFRQDNLIQSFVFWIILAVVYALKYYQLLKEREVQSSLLKTELAQAHLHSLKIQLQPHFLFNTLNSISSLLREKSEPAALKQNIGAADKMITHLSDMFRHTLSTIELQEVPLRDELRFLDNYLEIEKIRFSDRLTVKKEIDPKLETALVPSLLLQPIVENAVRHGIARLAGRGVIRIAIQNAGNSIRFLVQDNGPCSEEELKQSSQNGVGISNTIKRLHHLYGDLFRFEMKKNPDHETEVMIQLPLHN